MHLYKSHLFVETISVADPHSRHKRSSRKSKRSSGRSKCSSGSSVNEGQKIFSQNPETLAESFLETYKCYGKFCNLLQLVLRACMQMNFIACPYQKSSKDMAKKNCKQYLSGGKETTLQRKSGYLTLLPSTKQLSYNPPWPAMCWK